MRDATAPSARTPTVWILSCGCGYQAAARTQEAAEAALHDHLAYTTETKVRLV